MKAFISHTGEIRDFPKDHPFLKAALDGAREAGWAVDEMGDFPAAPLPPPAECERRVNACDAFVGVVGLLWGSAVPGKPGSSYTRFEFEVAQAAKKPALLFVIDEKAIGFPAGFMSVMSAEESRAQNAFRQDAMNGPTCKIVNTPHELQHEVYRSLTELRRILDDVKPLPDHDPPNPKPKVSIERLPTTGGQLFGRETSLRELNEAWETKRTSIVSLIGPAGSGKTSIINAWLANLATEDYRGAQAVFGWSFESREVDQPEVSTDTFFREALRFFGELNPPSNLTERGRRLAEIVSYERAILILDGLEAVQSPREPHELKDQAVQLLLKMLAAQNRGLCVVSSFIEVSELRPSVGKLVKVIPVGELSAVAGTDLLKSLKVAWTERDEREFTDAVEECRGHALSLTYLGAGLHKYKGGEIRRRNELEMEDLTDAGRRIEWIERWLGQGPELEILTVLGLFNRPAHIAAIDAVRAAPAIPNVTEHLVSRRAWSGAVATLRALKLLADARPDGTDRDFLDTNASVRQRFAQQLRDRYPDAWREANRRLFEYYRSLPSTSQPDTLDEMAHLFRAVVHGCRADRHQEVFNKVYWEGIRRGEEGYSVVRLNAWGPDLVAVSNFFMEGDWERPLPSLDALASARACTEAAFDLRGHGRLDEAIGAQLAGLRRYEDMGKWAGFCDQAGNLSELRTLHADLAEAERAARRSIEFWPKADAAAQDDEERCDAKVTYSFNLATLGNVLHQRGQLAQAEEQFAAADRIYREVKPEDPYLIRLPGYHYCDLLLSLDRLDEVDARAAFIAEEGRRAGRPYVVALALLAMARRRAVLAERGEPAQIDARARMADACAKLRLTGHSEMILRGLLASAELHRLMGELDAARKELDEVLERSGRVQMKLLEADAHLQLTYVERAAGNTAGERVHLDLCRGMVQAFGYSRRGAELNALAEPGGGGEPQRASAGGGATLRVGASVPASRVASGAQAFSQAQQQFVDLYLQANPVDGTQLGIPGNHDSRLPPVDPRQRADLFAELTASAHALRAAAEASGSVDDLVDGELAVAGVRGMRIVEDALRPYARNPGIYVDGVVRGVYSLLARTDLTVDQKAGPLAARLRAIPDILGRGQRQVSRPPRVLVDNAIGDAEGAQQFFEQELGDFVQALPEDSRKRELTDARRGAIDGMRSFARFVGGLTAVATDEFALGRTAFDALLHDVHQVQQDADELVELGRTVVADLEADLERASIKATVHRRWWEVVAGLEDRHPTRASLLDDYRKVLEQAREFVRQHDFVDLTKVGPLVVQATPPFARANLPFAAYIPAPPFANAGRGEFWVTPPPEGIGEDEERAALRRHHPGRLLVACVHEAYPGHHVQFDHAAHVKRPLRHFFASTVFSEGWGLYCEKLMRQEGFLMDGPDGPLLEISMLRDQLWRALRIVIDVGLHCKGMTREQAVALLVDKHVLDSPSAESEVMYYSSAPTQPMSYMVGRILMDSLIEKCRVARGSNAPLGRVRDEVLSHGSLPFPLLERIIGLGQHRSDPGMPVRRTADRA